MNIKMRVDFIIKVKLIYKVKFIIDNNNNLNNNIDNICNLNNLNLIRIIKNNQTKRKEFLYHKAIL